MFASLDIRKGSIVAQLYKLSFECVFADQLSVFSVIIRLLF